MVWEDHFKEGKEIILATSSKSGEPNVNITLSLGFVDNQLLMADSRMDTTIKNLRENGRVAVIGGYFKIKGTAKLFTSGEYYDICVKKIANFRVKTAILVKIDHVIDLENVKKIR
jgi:predicted pyridoxine 5'-phosphate oxidase superfamily flavin-nucleotide-binding protein